MEGRNTSRAYPEILEQNQQIVPISPLRDSLTFVGMLNM